LKVCAQCGKPFVGKGKLCVNCRFENFERGMKDVPSEQVNEALRREYNINQNIAEFNREIEKRQQTNT